MIQIISWGGPGWYHPMRNDGNAWYWTKVETKIDFRSQYFEKFPKGFLRG